MKQLLNLEGISNTRNMLDFNLAMNNASASQLDRLEKRLPRHEGAKRKKKEKTDAVV